MNDKAINILKERDYVVPSFLIKNYRDLGISPKNVLLIIYLINLKEPIVCDYQQISTDLNMDIKELMADINDLVEKKLIQIDIKKNSSSKLEEYVNLDLFYNKVFLKMIDVKEEKDDSNIYSIFERELDIFSTMTAPFDFCVAGKV